MQRNPGQKLRIKRIRRSRNEPSLSNFGRLGRRRRPTQESLRHRQRSRTRRKQVRRHSPSDRYPSIVGAVSEGHGSPLERSNKNLHCTNIPLSFYSLHYPSNCICDVFENGTRWFTSYSLTRLNLLFRSPHRPPRMLAGAGAASTPEPTPSTPR